jgi:hypothetical protein
MAHHRLDVDEVKALRGEGAERMPQIPGNRSSGMSGSSRCAASRAFMYRRRKADPSRCSPSCRPDARVGSQPGDGDVLAAEAVQGVGASVAAVCRCGHEFGRSCGGLGVLARVRYQAKVAAMAVVSGVPAVSNVDWYLVVSSTKGSSNS